MIRWFININTWLCDKIENLLPTKFTRSLLHLHELTAARIMSERPAQMIVDIGGGHLCPFAEHARNDPDTKVLSVDILHSQLLNNAVADYRVAADVCQGIPLANESCDIMVTRSVIEHLNDNESFIQDSMRVLKENGYCIHVFPCKFAPFAIFNQIIPNKIAQRMLNYIFPQWKEEVGFKAYYNKTYYPAFINLLKKSGFKIEELHIRYYQSIYYKFFLPLYLIFLVYDLTLWILRIKPLCCQMLIVANKPPHS